MPRLATSEARTDLPPIKDGARMSCHNNPGRDGGFDLHLHVASACVETHITLCPNVGNLTKFGQDGLDLTLWNTIR